MISCTQESEYLLSDYISDEKRLIKVENRTYELQLFQGDHSNEYLLSEMKDGKVEGRCQLFNRGILSLAWIVKNGKRVGDVTNYENGKAIQKERWDSVLGSVERRVIENTQTGLIMSIRYRHESEDESLKNREVVIYRGGFDEEMNRNGYGIEYDRETGEKSYQGYWEKNKLIRVIREFDNKKNVMIEYVNIMNSDIWKRVPIYIGEYCFENDTFLRHGTGYLIDELSGAAVREGLWDHGMEVSGVDLFDGWYIQGMKESIRSVLNKEEPAEMENAPSFPEMSVEIHNNELLSLTNLEVTDLTIASKSGTDIQTLDLNKYKWLQSLRIGNDCFNKVKVFNINGLKRLHKIKIGSNSFTLQKDSYGMESEKSFYVSNCEELESINIGRYSFSDFAGPFELKDLPCLRTLKIGAVGKESYNFYSASFVVLSRNRFEN